MATSRSMEQIRWNVANGYSSAEDLKTVLSRYDQLLEDVREEAPILYQQYKKREKSRDE